MEISSCQPHLQCIQIELLGYEDAMLLKAILQQEDSPHHRRLNRWSELIGALELIIIANQPAETLSKQMNA